LLIFIYKFKYKLSKKQFFNAFIKFYSTMEHKDLIRRIFNTLFIHKNTEGELEYRIATAGLSAKKVFRSTSTGETCMEEIRFPKMPMHPANKLPLEPGFYREVCVLVFFNDEYVIRMEDINLDGEVSIQTIFNTAKEIGKAFVVGKTYSDKSKSTIPSMQIDIDGKKISISKDGDAYCIKDEDDIVISPNSKEGKDAIRKYIKSQIN
jgi:hypothetical protein